VYIGNDERETLRQKRSVSRKELTGIRRKLDRFENNMEVLLNALMNIDESELQKQWTLKFGQTSN